MISRIELLVPFIGQMKEGFLCGAVWTEAKLKARNEGVLE